MDKFSKKSDVIAAAASSPVVKSRNKGAKKRDAEEKIDKKLDLKKKKKVAASQKQDFSTEKDSCKSNNQPWMLIRHSESGTIWEAPDVGAAAPAVKKEESSHERMTTPFLQVQRIGTSKTVLAKNLPFSWNKSDVIKFFEKAGEIVDARYKVEGFKGTYYFDYTTEEAAKKALEFDGRLLRRKRFRGGRAVRGTGTSKTLVTMNLSSSTTKSDVIKFFEGAGEIVDVRFSYHSCGKFRGVCNVEFATEEAAKEAIKLNGTYLLDSCVELGFSRESIFIRGFDTSSGIDQIRSSLKEHFSSCGKILWMHIPTVDCTGAARGIAFIEFYNPEAFPKALAMNGHKLGDFPLTIEDATPLHLNVEGMGGRSVLSRGRFGPYGGTTYVHRYLMRSDKGYGGAGLGKFGSPYRLPLGKKIRFDDDETEGGEAGHGACTQS